MQVHNLEYGVYFRVDVIYLLGKTCFEELSYRAFAEFWRHYLMRHGDACPARDLYLSALGRVRAIDELEDGRLPGTVLSHESDLHATAHGEVSLIEDRVVMPVFVRHFFKAKQCGAQGRLCILLFCHFLYPTSCGLIGEPLRFSLPIPLPCENEPQEAT